MGRVELPSKVYESFVLTVELHRQRIIEGSYLGLFYSIFKMNSTSTKKRLAPLGFMRKVVLSYRSVQNRIQEKMISKD